MFWVISRQLTSSYHGLSAKIMKVCGKCNVLGDLVASEKVVQWIVNWHDKHSNELYNDPLFAKVKNIYDEKRLSKCWNDNFISLEDWIKNEQGSAQLSNNTA